MLILKDAREWPREPTHIYDVGPPFFERVFPDNELSPMTKRRLFAEVRNWIMPVLVRADADHPLFRLWGRKDWLASCELLSLGLNLRRLTAPSRFRGFLRNSRRKICGNDAGNRAGHAWELSCAAMLNHPTQPVHPPKSGEPGFDLWVEPDGGPRVRVSCKALDASQNEKEFRRFCVDLQQRVEAFLPVDRPLQIVMTLRRDRAAEDLLVASVAERVAECIRQATREKRVFATGGWSIHVRPYLHAVPFAPSEASYSLTVAAEYPKDEQVRFFSLLDRAIANLTEHCSKVDAGVSNAIFIRVPPPILMKEAREIVRSKLNKATAHISMVALFRTQLVVKDVQGGVRLGQEHLYLHNPDATVHIPDLKVELPIGVLGEEPSFVLVAGGKTVKLQRCYLFSQGHRCHAARVEGDSYRFEIRKVFVESISYVGRVAGMDLRVDAPGSPNWTLML